MARKDRFPDLYSTGSVHDNESEGSDCSGRIDNEIAVSENSSAPKRKWSGLSHSLHDGFVVPMEVLRLSKMSLRERKDLLVTLRGKLEQIRVLQKRAENPSNVSTWPSTGGIVNNSQNVPIAGNVRNPSSLSNGLGEKLNRASTTGPTFKRDISGRFESAKKLVKPCSSSSTLMKQCESLLKKLMSHDYGWVFNTPVDVVKLNIPDYFNVIKHPMDLGTIKRKITSHEYSSPLDFAADVRLTFTNAMTYNPPGNDVHLMAATLGKFFEVRWKAIEKKLPVNISHPLPEASSIHIETDNVKPMGPAKKRKVNAVQQIVVPEPIVRPIMTFEEKTKLSRELESLGGDLPDNIIEFLKEQSSTGNEATDDEIEIDIDALSDDTLFKLQKLIHDYLHEKQKQTEGEPCEIELRHESGLSNSSLQLGKGNEVIDEDVEVEGTEAPVSSYPPAELQENSGQRSNKCTSPGNSHESDSRSFSKLDAARASSPVKFVEEIGPVTDFDEKAGVGDLVDGNQTSGLDQLEETSQQKPNSVESDSRQDGESAVPGRPVSPDKLYRAAILKRRFADTILKAREKTLNQGEKVDPERLRREKEELELQKRKEKARLLAEAVAAEDARKQAEAEASAEAKRQRELEREAARQALLQMEKTVEINETSKFLKDLEMLRTAPPEQIPSYIDETSPEPVLDGLGSFKFGDCNPLEQLGLFMKEDEEEEECEPPSVAEVVNDVEEGEID